MSVVTGKPVGFFDLPAEIRDMIYAHFRPFSWIDITNMPGKIHQPSIAKVSRKVRKECLDVFYSQNRFMLDMRGWKDSKYPKSWTPNDIFNHWIMAIGNENAARIRHVSFYLSNFAVHFTVNTEQPRVTFKFRQTLSNTMYIDVAEDAPPGYNFTVASQRAQKRLAYVVDQLSQEIGDQPLTSMNIRALCDIVEALKPTLCTRPSVGWKGAILPPLESTEPSVECHLASCSECGYARIVDSAD